MEEYNRSITLLKKAHKDTTKKVNSLFLEEKNLQNIIILLSKFRF
jgi:hypothetical protein